MWLNESGLPVGGRLAAPSMSTSPRYQVSFWSRGAVLPVGSFISGHFTKSASQTQSPKLPTSRHSAHSTFDFPETVSFVPILSALECMNPKTVAKAKSLGFSDRQIAHLTGQTKTPSAPSGRSSDWCPSYRLVDTCAAEFEAYTPYYTRPTTAATDEVNPSNRKKVMILGGGLEPHRPGHRV